MVLSIMGLVQFIQVPVSRCSVSSCIQKTVHVFQITFGPHPFGAEQDPQHFEQVHLHWFSAQLISSPCLSIILGFKGTSLPPR